MIEWIDLTNNWDKIYDLKEPYPIKVAKYDKGDDLLIKPLFAWWCPTFPCQNMRVISKVKYNYCK